MDGVISECSCGQEFATGREHAGRHFKCRHCGAELVVPMPDDATGEDAVVWIRNARNGGATRGAIRSQLHTWGADSNETALLMDEALGASKAVVIREERAAAAKKALIIGIVVFVAFNILAHILDLPFRIGFGR